MYLPWKCKLTIRIAVIYWVVKAIDKWIAPQCTLTSRCKSIRIEESANLRVVVSGLEVVELVLYCTIDCLMSLFYRIFALSVKSL